MIIRNLYRELKRYIRYCPTCWWNLTPRHKPYGSLQPILTAPELFHTIAIAFIVALPNIGSGEIQLDSDCNGKVLKESWSDRRAQQLLR